MHGHGTLVLCPRSYDLELGSLVDSALSKVLMPMWPICGCGLPMRGRCACAWNFGHVTFDLGAIPVNLGMSWTLVVSMCLFQTTLRGRCAWA